MLIEPFKIPCLEVHRQKIKLMNSKQVQLTGSNAKFVTNQIYEAA